jgi:La-related protein 7
LYPGAITRASSGSGPLLPRPSPNPSKPLTMPQLEGADQIAAGCTATDAERPGELRRSGSATRLNAQAPEFVPRGPPAVVAVVPPPVIRVCAAPPPPPRAAFFAAPPPPPPPFEYHAPVGGCGGFAAKELKPMPDPLPEPELENPPVVEAEQLVLVEGLPDEVVHKITKQVGAVFPVDMIRSGATITRVWSNLNYGD